MASGNPLAPPGMGAMPSGMRPPGGANPGGPVPQPGAGTGGRPAEVGRRPFDGAGASLIAPPPAAQPSAGPPSPQNGVPASKQRQPFADIHQAFNQSKAQYEMGMKAQGVLDHLRTELDILMEKGDIIRPEDVIEAAGRLVGHGLGAAQLAQIMSDMPATGGEGLASWVRMHEQSIFAVEQQLAQQNNMMRHQLGVSSIKSLAASHLEQMGNEGRQAISQEAVAPSNALGGGIEPETGAEGVGG